MAQGQWKKTLGQQLLEMWVLFKCTLAMRAPISRKALALARVTEKYPRTLQRANPAKLARILVKGYAACLEREDVEAAAAIARVLKERGRYRAVVQERMFSVAVREKAKAICDNTIVRMKNIGIGGATEERGAYIVYMGLRVLADMGYEIPLKTLHATALLADKGTNGEFSPVTTAMIRDRCLKREKSGRKGLVTKGEQRFLLRHY